MQIKVINQLVLFVLLFHTVSDAPLDLKIKASMLSDMFTLVGECYVNSCSILYLALGDCV